MVNPKRYDKAEEERDQRLDDEAFGAYQPNHRCSGFDEVFEFGSSVTGRTRGFKGLHGDVVVDEGCEDLYYLESFGRVVESRRAIEDIHGDAYWLTATNEPVRMKDMQTKHLINCIRMIKRGDAPDRTAFLKDLEQELGRRQCKADFWRVPTGGQV